MDEKQLKKAVEVSFSRGSKSDLYKALESTDDAFIVDVLWDLFEESDDGRVNKRELEELREKIKQLNNKSGFRTKCIKLLPERRALVQLGPLKEEVMISPNIDISKLKPGVEVLVIGGNEGRILAEIRDPDIRSGRLAKVKRVLDDARIAIEDGGNELILNCAEGVICKDGDEIRYELESLMVMEVIAENEKSSYEIEQIPDITLDNVKGLKEEKKLIMEKIIYPSIYKDKFEIYGLKTIRGAIFYGPSGCGKTFLASAIFNEMSKLRIKNVSTLKEKTSRKGFFIINGPSILSKWVGQAEQTIRKIFSDARIAAKESGFPSVIFWDEIESIAGRRKDVDSYTPEKTIVPTLLAELHGVNSDNNVILISATNMPSLIDPALMRPGRLGDLILEIPRPDREAAFDILNSTLNKNIPESLNKLILDGLVEKIVKHIYDNENPIAYSKKVSELVALNRTEMVNGALFSSIGEELVRKACISEIEDVDFITVEEIIKMVDKNLLMQIGALDKGVKCGFNFDVNNLVLEVGFDG